jgi:hypothetical protein
MGIQRGLVIETTLDPKAQAFLHDHQIDGTPVLPGVMGLEAMAEAAQLLFPEHHVAAIENVQFMAPFKFYRSQPRTVTVNAVFAMENDDIVAQCRLIGLRTLHGQSQAETTVHFSARIRLTARQGETGKRDRVSPPKGKKVGTPDIYKVYFHGPAYQVLDSSWKAGDSVVGHLSGKLPVNHKPENLATLVAPRLIELCFQTAGVWELASKARMGLPSGIGRMQMMQLPQNAANLFAIVKPLPDGAFDAELVDLEGNIYFTLAGYRTMEMPESVDAALLKPLQNILA